MQAEIHPWEHTLLSLAFAAHEAQTPALDPQVTSDLLAASYDYCARLTAANSRSFYLASSLLPYEKRTAVRALYAFCRVTDDIVDRAPSGESALKLESWRRRIALATPPADDLVAWAWVDARRRYAIPWLYAEQLIDGVARDTRQSRYETFDELASYSYGVASTVGLMSMHIIGYEGSHAIPYAIKLGVALQLTNILRDVGEDWTKGRLYLPQDEMAGFGVSEEEIGLRRVTPRWREFMRFQIERNRRLYDEAWPGIAMLNRDGRFAIAAAADFYRSILSAIEANDFDTLTRRAFVSGSRKLGMLLGIWLRSRRVRRG